MVVTIEKEQTIVAELECICNSYNGYLRPSDIVSWAAENPNSTLYDQFEWDDAKAGDAYRLWQARALIASVKVTIEASGKTESIRAYVSLKEDRYPGAGYRLLVDVLSDEIARKSLLTQALSELNRVLCKYRQLVELAGVQVEVDRLITDALP